MRNFLLVLLVGCFHSAAFADKVVDSCSTTIKCASGTASCSSNSTFFDTTTECGLPEGKALSCHSSSKNDTPTESIRYICCSAAGIATTTYSKAIADQVCDNHGVIQ